MVGLTLLEKLFQQGRLSRREFISRTAALGALSALPLGLRPRSARASTPKKGGLLRMGLTGASLDDDLDVGLSCCDDWELTITFQTRNCLSEFNSQGEPIPELAESWESTPDASRWIFNIRKGVEFHNGKTLDADDVVYSFNHHRGEKSKSVAKLLLSAVKDIRTDGKYSVVFDLDYGCADMPAMVGDYHFQIVPNSYQNWNDGMGTGGYILQELVPGVRAFSVRNPNYWKEGRAHFDAIECIGINDCSARTNALRTGKIHLMDEPDLKTAHLLDQIPGIQVIPVRGMTHHTIPMLTDFTPYDEELVDKILRGYGSVGNDHPISPSNRYYAADLPQREYDPEKAKFLLKKAGMEGHTFKIHAAEAAYTGAVDTALLIKESAKKAGVDIEVVREPNDGYWSNVWRIKPWCFCTWTARPTEDMMFSTAYAAEAPWNDAHWKHNRFNNLLKEARAELDDSKRREMYVEMQRIVRDEGGTIVHIWTDDLIAISSKLKYEEPIAGHFQLDGQRLTEKWWFEA